MQEAGGGGGGGHGGHRPPSFLDWGGAQGAPRNCTSTYRSLITEDLRTILRAVKQCY